MDISGRLIRVNISVKVSAMNTEEETTPIPQRKTTRRTVYAKMVTGRPWLRSVMINNAQTGGRRKKVSIRKPVDLYQGL